jgi:long-chain acyl-CoA synthetase
MSASLIFEDVERDAATLRERGARLAGGLARLGVREGDVLAVLLRNGPVFADVMFACRTAGVYFAPLNWHFTPDEIAYIVRDCGARVVIGDGDLLAPASGAFADDAVLLAAGEAMPQAGDSSRFIAYEPWLAEQRPYDGPARSPRGHFQYTSGTTGRPKGVRRDPVPLAEVDARAAAMRRVVRVAYGIEDGCRTLVSAPLYHSAPSSIAQNTLLYGSLLVLAPRFDPARTLELIDRHRIEIAYLTPTMYVRLLRLPDAVWDRYDGSSLRFVASTGAPCAPDVKRAIIERLGPVVHETYASTEAGTITIASSEDALAKPGTAGRPILDACVRIVADDGRPCAPGEIGTIYARQPAYADFTYQNLPDARRAMERDGLLTLGDVGYLDEDGFLFVCDRSADMVLSGGVNVYPAEIEHALLRVPGVLDCAVVGIPDAEFGERLHAFVQPDAGAALDAGEIAAVLRRTIAGFKVPRGFTFTDALPRDDNGKVARRKLRALAAEAVAPA